MYNYLFNRHDLGINKLAQIHFKIFCFPSCQNDRGRFCCFLRGLAAPFPCGSLIDAFPGSSAGGSGFSPMIESIFCILLRRWPLQGVLAHPAACAERSCVPSNGIRLSALRLESRRSAHVRGVALMLSAHSAHVRIEATCCK